MKNFKNYIKESIKEDFEDGEIVLVNGNVDEQEFNDDLCKIINKAPKSHHRTNVDKHGNVGDVYNYYGVSYLIVKMKDQFGWYVPVYNIKKIDNFDKKNIKWFN